MKKILSVMLAILMIVTTVPAASFAADAEFLHECTHESVIDGKCESCEKTLKKVVIDMTDSWGDGWSDNKIVIEQLVDGEFKMIAKATIDDGEADVFNMFIEDGEIYAFKWIEGDLSEDCEFTITIDGEKVYEPLNGSYLDDGETFYAICPHESLTVCVCDVCGLEVHDWSEKDGVCAREDCGYKCWHIYTDGVCDTCGFICLHDGYTGYQTCIGYWCYTCYSWFGEPNETNHSWIDGVCENCGVACEHKGGVQTCKGKKCLICDSWYDSKDETKHVYNESGYCMFCDEECPHEESEQQTCQGYICKICGGFCGEPNDSHSGGEQTCMGYECEKCWEWYGEPDETKHSYYKGICEYCHEPCPQKLTEEQSCCGYRCEICGYWHGEADETKHSWSYGFCEYCSTKYPAYNVCTHEKLEDEQTCMGYKCMTCGKWTGISDGTKHSWSYGECGFCHSAYPEDEICIHKYDKTGICEICRNVCPHDSVKDNVCESCHNAEFFFALVKGEEEVCYSSLSEALDKAEDGDVIKLISDCNSDESAEIKKVITFDFNGYRLESPYSTMIEVYNAVTFTDSVGGGGTDYFIRAWYPITFEGGSYLRIENVVPLTGFNDFLAPCRAYYNNDGEKLDLSGERTVYDVTVDEGNHTFGENGKCVNCGSECTHKSYTSAEDGNCPDCGALITGRPLIIDVSKSDNTQYYVGGDYSESVYDEDGIIFTGYNENVGIDILKGCKLTFDNLTVDNVDDGAADDTVYITLKGVNEMKNYFGFYKADFIVDGDEDAVLKFDYMSTGGNDGTFTLNGGNLILDTETDEKFPTLSNKALVINGGSITASNNYHYTLLCPVELNSGTLNIISTASDCAAIDNKVIMKKGTLLTVSAESTMLSDWYGTGIAISETENENSFLFVRYDKESAFVPVSDIKAALEGKHYAEIKVDSHTHLYENGKCVCGLECVHKEATDKGFEATCNKKGLTDGSHCTVCSMILTAQKEIPVVSHKDTNGDYKCDFGCGYEFPKPVTPTEPSTEPTIKPSEPSTEPTTKPGAEDTTKPSTEPTTNPGDEDTTKPSTEPTTKPGAEDTTKPSTEPTTKPGAEDTTKPSTEPTTKPGAEETTKPTETTKPAETTKPTETTKPAEPTTTPSTEEPTTQHTHTEVVIPAVKATYTADGLTAGKKCSECGEILVKQKKVARKKLKKVTSLKKKAVKLASGSKTTLTLSWKKVTGAEKYVVQQYVNKKWKTVATTKKTYYTVKKLKANKSYKFRVKAKAGKYYGSYSKTYTAKTVPLKPTLTVKAGKKKLTASWKTVANITGYEVQYSTSKKFTKKTTKKVTIKKAKTKKTTIKKLKKGKKYYVKVRAYKTVGKKKIYSSWSTVKTVKVK